MDDSDRQLILRHIDALYHYYLDKRHEDPKPAYDYKLNRYKEVIHKLEDPNMTLDKLNDSVGEKMKNHIKFALDPYSVAGDEADWTVRNITYTTKADKIDEEIIPAVQARTIAENIISMLPSGYRGVIVGSLARGAPHVRDIDVLIYKDRAKLMPDFRPVFKTIAKELSCSVISMGDQNTMLKCGPYQIDLFGTTKDNLAFAQLHFVGSSSFIIQMSAKARKMGYKLNQYGLFSLEDNTRVAGLKSEQDIFNFLKIKYVRPAERY